MQWTNPAFVQLRLSSERRIRLTGLCMGILILVLRGNSWGVLRLWIFPSMDSQQIGKLLLIFFICVVVYARAKPCFKLIQYESFCVYVIVNFINSIQILSTYTNCKVFYVLGVQLWNCHFACRDFSIHYFVIFGNDKCCSYFGKIFILLFSYCSGTTL